MLCGGLCLHLSFTDTNGIYFASTTQENVQPRRGHHFTPTRKKLAPQMVGVEFRDFLCSQRGFSRADIQTLSVFPSAELTMGLLLRLSRRICSVLEVPLPPFVLDDCVLAVLRRASSWSRLTLAAAGDDVDALELRPKHRTSRNPKHTAFTNPALSWV